MRRIPGTLVVFVLVCAAAAVPGQDAGSGHPQLATAAAFTDALIVDILVAPNKYWNTTVGVQGHVVRTIPDPPGTGRGSYILRDRSDRDIEVLTSTLPPIGTQLCVTGIVRQLALTQTVPLLVEEARGQSFASLRPMAAPRLPSRPATPPEQPPPPSRVILPPPVPAISSPASNSGLGRFVNATGDARIIITESAAGVFATLQEAPASWGPLLTAGDKLLLMGRRDGATIKATLIRVPTDGQCPGLRRLMVDAAVTLDEQGTTLSITADQATYSVPECRWRIVKQPVTEIWKRPGT